MRQLFGITLLFVAGCGTTIGDPFAKARTNCVERGVTTDEFTAVTQMMQSIHDDGADYFDSMSVAMEACADAYSAALQPDCEICMTGIVAAIYGR